MSKQLMGTANSLTIMRISRPLYHHISTNSCCNSLLNIDYLASTIQHFIDSDSPRGGQTIHSLIITNRIELNTNISIKLLILHLKCKSLLNARHVFDQMPRKTVSAYNYLISGYMKNNLAKESLDLVQSLLSSDKRPDGFILAMVLKAAAMLASLNSVRQVHAHIIKMNFGSDDFLFSALVDSYVKNEKIDCARGVYAVMAEKSLVCSTALLVGFMNQGSFMEAEEIFKSILNKDVVVYNAMIEGYNKTIETARRSLELYKSMQHLSFKPTTSTLVSVVGACTLLSELEFGKQVHAQAVKSMIFSHVKSGSALMDMYSKCGRFEDARRIFDLMPERNVITWTSMIDGYGKNGLPCEALKLFREMKRVHDVPPNHATFLSALSACGHAGLVSDGKEIFESMERDYLLQPRMEHYACMVDLLGRNGSLHEACSFIGKMPEKPNVDVWTALLAASRLHGDKELAEIAAMEVFKLNKDGRRGAYIALSDAFAASGEWQGVSKVRELMKDRGLSEGTGLSWVAENCKH